MASPVLRRRTLLVCLVTIVPLALGTQLELKTGKNPTETYLESVQGDDKCKFCVAFLHGLFSDNDRCGKAKIYDPDLCAVDQRTDCNRVCGYDGITCRYETHKSEAFGLAKSAGQTPFSGLHYWHQCGTFWPSFSQLGSVREAVAAELDGGKDVGSINWKSMCREYVSAWKPTNGWVKLPSEFKLDQLCVDGTSLLEEEVTAGGDDSSTDSEETTELDVDILGFPEMHLPTHLLSLTGAPHLQALLTNAYCGPFERGFLGLRKLAWPNRDRLDGLIRKFTADDMYNIKSMASTDEKRKFVKFLCESDKLLSDSKVLGLSIEQIMNVKYQSGHLDVGVGASITRALGILMRSSGVIFLSDLKGNSDPLKPKMMFENIPADVLSKLLLAYTKWPVVFKNKNGIRQVSMYCGELFNDPGVAAREIEKYIKSYNPNLAEVKDFDCCPGESCCDEPNSDECRSACSALAPLDRNMFPTHNHFFYRKLDESARRHLCYARDMKDCPGDPPKEQIFLIDEMQTVETRDEIISPADARSHVFTDISDVNKFWVKGDAFQLNSLVRMSVSELEYYDQGSILISRLAPQDYHRFHFPVDGTVCGTEHYNGEYYSVSPIAVGSGTPVFSANKRMHTYIWNDDIGCVAYVSVGATCVSSIIFTSFYGQEVKKGMEHGYMSFGGSTVMSIFPSGSVEWDRRVKFNTEIGFETMVKMGDTLGRKASGSAATHQAFARSPCATSCPQSVRDRVMGKDVSNLAEPTTQPDDIDAPAPERLPWEFVDSTMLAKTHRTFKSRFMEALDLPLGDGRARVRENEFRDALVSGERHKALRADNLDLGSHTYQRHSAQFQPVAWNEGFDIDPKKVQAMNEAVEKSYSVEKRPLSRSGKSVLSLKKKRSPQMKSLTNEAGVDMAAILGGAGSVLQDANKLKYRTKSVASSSDDDSQ